MAADDFQARIKATTDNRGEKCPTQWITDEQIHQIRRWLTDDVKGKTIADQIGCSNAQISNIKNGKQRQHLNTPGLWEWSEEDQVGRWITGKFA